MCAGNLPVFCGTGAFAPAGPVAPVAPVVGVVTGSGAGATVEGEVTPWANATAGSATAAPSDNPVATSEMRSLPFTPLILPCEGRRRFTAGYGTSLARNACTGIGN